MKISITLFLITIVTFSGGVDTTVQPPQQPPKAIVISDETLIEKKTDTIVEKYFEQINYRNISLNKLIVEKKKADREIAKLNAEIKHLKKINSFLKNNNNTVYIHDTVFKKRKILQLFKK